MACVCKHFTSSIIIIPAYKRPTTGLRRPLHLMSSGTLQKATKAILTNKLNPSTLI